MVAFVVLSSKAPLRGRAFQLVVVSQRRSRAAASEGRLRRRVAKYDHLEVERRWQDFWEEQQTFRAPTMPRGDKKYILDMFPYPSGSGLHVGHPAGYTASDAYARYSRHKGYDVLHPMGWDAFGLPAEQHAIQTGTHPRVTTKENVETFKRQLKSLGFSYDWRRELATTDETYFKWTQSIFLLLFERGLAEQKDVAVNWCPELGTVLANEEVIDGKSERGSFPVVRQPLRQWVLKITEYADKLLEDLDTLQWPQGTLRSQREWIGKSVGATVVFDVLDDLEDDESGGKQKIEVFTTRPDTLLGATYLVVAPEHPLVVDVAAQSENTDVAAYVEATKAKSDLERTAGKEKTGAFTGLYGEHPLTGEPLPIWVADYVLGGYGTGAVMAVPAHDQRDFDFANTFDLPITQVVFLDDEKDQLPLCEASKEATVYGGDFFQGLSVEEAKTKVVELLEERGRGGFETTYKLRDWVFSRQRYWGEPIPIYFPVVDKVTGDAVVASSSESYDEAKHDIRYDAPIAVPLDELPLTLPEMEDFSPGSDPLGCLARAADWRFFHRDGLLYARETNTMPQWAGSCWYYLRFADNLNAEALIDPDIERTWLPVDLYVGGSEHAVLHLLYARFWHKVLFDAGVVSSKEPFEKLVHQGMILGADGEKMSKSRGNVVNPDDIVQASGADALRLYEMFMGPLDAVKPWQTSQVAGVVRFRDRVYSLAAKVRDQEKEQQEHHSQGGDDRIALSPETTSLLHKTMRKVTQDMESLSFNTAISALMILANHLATLNPLPREPVEKLAVMISPFAPHVAEESWAMLHQHLRQTNDEPRSIAYEPWVTWDDAKCIDESVTVAVQVNGKVRSKLQLTRDAKEADVRQLALADPAVGKFVAPDATIKKFIYVPGRIVNIVL